MTRDYLELEYRDGDRVFVPSDQLHKISRYVGADAGDPPLSKLGGKQWEQMKLKARRAAQALAGELINLYAERKRRAGHAFPHDTEWQLEFEGALPLPRDARPARGDRGRARRHGGGAPDGPPDLRRRGLRQDRGGAARRLQGRRGRQAGDVPRADHRPRPAALRHLQRAPARLPVPDRDGVALPLAQGRARDARRLPRGQGRHPDRHAPPALARRAPEGARTADRRRGAALRRQAEGAAAPAQAEGGRAVAVGHADPAHAPDVARRPARHLGDRDAARGPPPGEDLRGRLRRRPGGARRSSASSSAAARPSSSTTGWRRSTRPPSASARSCPTRASSSPTARWPRASSSR